MPNLLRAEHNLQRRNTKTPYSGNKSDDATPLRTPDFSRSIIPSGGWSWCTSLTIRSANDFAILMRAKKQVRGKKTCDCVGRLFFFSVGFVFGIACSSARTIPELLADQASASKMQQPQTCKIQPRILSAMRASDTRSR